MTLQPVTGVSPVRDVLINLSPLVPTLAGVAIVGRPAIWLGVLLPVGAFAIGVPLAGRREAGRKNAINAIELALSVGGGLLLTYIVVSIALRVPAISLLIPVGALAILMLAANWCFLTAAAATRAVRGEINNHPFVYRARRHLPWLTEGRGS